MAISITCPGCQSVYPVPETLAGKTIRCKKCGETVAVSAPAAAPVAARPAAARPVAAKRVAQVVDDDVAIPARPARSRRDLDNDTPREANRDRPQPEKKGAKLPLVLGAVLGGLVLGAAGVGALFAAGVFGGDSKPTDVVETTRPTGMPGITDPGRGEDDEPKKTTTPADTDAADKGGAQKQPTRKDSDKPPQVVGPIQPMTPPPATGQLMASGMSPERLMVGQMDRITTDRVARATVLILGEGHNGSAWTGSGWFGIESGLVFTNAHVLDMKAPDSKPPAKLTIHTYKPDATAGARIAPDKVIPHSKIKILGVDRDNDLAVLQIINEPDLPAPLNVRPSSELQVRQGLTVFGFPLTGTLIKVGGLSKDKMPEMSVRPTTVTALRLDDMGRPKYVQTEGGSNQGNSGGPVVDAEGYVVGLVVIGINNVQTRQATSIAMCVPTEWVFGLLAGRVDEVEYDQPYRKDGKIRVPVSVRCLDPMKRLQKVGIGYWVGEPSTAHRPHGEKKPEKLPTDLDHKFADLKYDPDTKTATGELEFPELPTGRAYWTQAFYANAVQRDGYWMPGLTMKLSGPPVDRMPADLIVRLPRGTTRSIELSNSSDLTEFAEGEGESKSERELLRTTIKMNETVGPGNPQAGSTATLGFKYQSIDLKSEEGRSEDEALPKRALALLNENITRMEAAAQVNARGETFRYQSNIRGIPNQSLGWILQHFSDEAMESLQVCSISLPNKQVQPLEKWETKKLGRLYQLDLEAAKNELFPPNPGGPNGPGGGQPRKGPVQLKVKELRFEQKIVYTYLGMRTRLGQREAIVRIDGTVGKAPGAKETASGEIKGYVMIEVDTGTVVLAEVESNYEVDSSSSGLRKKVSGVNKYKLNRGSSIK